MTHPTTRKTIRRMRRHGYSLYEISRVTGSRLPAVKETLGEPARASHLAELRAEGHAERVIRACFGI